MAMYLLIVLFFFQNSKIYIFVLQTCFTTFFLNEIKKESLVHPPLFQAALLAEEINGENGSKVPKSVFIGGGGELATAREVLRHKSVERVVMVDIDGVVVECCKKYLPEWGGEAVTSNPRFELVIGDAYDYLLKCNEKFDVIILDISDPIEAGPGVMLYTKEFYDHAQTLLTDNGVFVTQAGTADTVPSPTVAGGLSDSFGPIANTLGAVFDCIVPYTINIPSFGGDWGFVMAFNSKNKNPKQATMDAMLQPIDKIDSMISSRIGDLNDIENSTKDGHSYLRHYDGMAHHRMCFLPKLLRTIVEDEDRVITKDNPIFMY